jgi:asparagine synthase (glutamine-hydrolysing)
MCGIIAIVSFKNHIHNLSRLDEMARLIRHRGPDDEGYALFDVKSGEYRIFSGEDTPMDVVGSQLRFLPKVKYQYTSNNFTVALAHRRLSIIDLTAAGHQPMSDETGRFWIAYNGEVYNFKEIRKELINKGHRFISNTDTEVVLKSYMTWGPECQKKFNGMWSLTIWDNLKRELWISRDRMGVKPLYYMLHDDFFIVCSELKCLMPIIVLRPNLREIYAYLLDGPSEAHPETFFDKVNRFPAGHGALLKINSGDRKLVLDKYWELSHPSEEIAFSDKKLKDLAEQYYNLLADAVRVRLFADVKVGCALSGGLDSSSISYLAYKVIRDHGNGGEAITVSNIYRGEGEEYCDESKYIDIMVNHLNVRSFRGTPEKMDVLTTNDKGIWVEENCYDKFNVAAYNTYALCKKNSIKVTLDGQGADEQLAGYTRFWYSYFYSHPKKRLEYFASFLKGVIPYRLAIYYSLFNSESIKNRFSPRSSSARQLDDYRSSRNVLSQDNYFLTVNNAAHWSTKNSLKKLLRQIDSNSMAWSIESRQPFMDYRLVEFLNDLPDVYKMHGGWTKYISRIAFKGKLPSSITWRKDKMGWPMPLKEWIRGDVLDEMNMSIVESTLLQELKSKYKYEYCHGNNSDSLHGGTLRQFMRLYNVSRVEKLFFKV